MVVLGGFAERRWPHYLRQADSLVVQLIVSPHPRASARRSRRTSSMNSRSDEQGTARGRQAGVLTHFGVARASART